MFMILAIIDEWSKWQAVLEAWTQAGAPGVTVLPSTGLGRICKKIGLTGELPLMPSLMDFIQDEEDRHHTLFTIVREREVVDRIIAATQEILGDLNLPNTGILAVLPVLEAYGLDRRRK